MNILCLSDAFWPDHTGGITKSLLSKVEGLVDLSHEITVVCRRLQANHPYHETRAGYELYRYISPFRGSLAYRLYPLFSLTNSAQMSAQLHHRRAFDVAYVNDPFQAISLFRTLPNLPYIYNYHASASSEIQIDAAQGKYGLLKPLMGTVTNWVRTAEYKALTNARRIIVDSQFMRQDLSQLYPDINLSKVKHIPLPVDTRRFSPTGNKAVPRQKLGLPTNQTILLTIRRLVARMGIENLITAMKIVANNFPDVLLLIGGTGYLKERFMTMIQQANLESNIKLLGFIPEELLATYYQSVDLFVLPTLLYEGFGLVIIEALACGTPVIATPIGAISDVLGPLGQEFLFHDNTPEAIAAGINHWLDRGVSREVQKSCQAFCMEHFNKEKICRQLEDVFVEVVAPEDGSYRTNGIVSP